MSYNETLNHLLHLELARFYNFYGTELDEETTHDHAYTFHRSMAYVKSYHDVSKFMSDENVVIHAEMLLREASHMSIIDLTNHALKNVISDYIISNY